MEELLTIPKSKIILEDLLEERAVGMETLKCHSINSSKYTLEEAAALRKQILKIRPEDNRVEQHRLVMSDHTEERWNERVGPIADLSSLISLFEYVLTYEPYRLDFVTEEFAYLDDDICFCYGIEDNAFIIRTFYGRASLIPSLSQIAKMKNFNYNKNDQLKLSLTAEEINRQVFPKCPNMHSSFINKNGQVFNLLICQSEKSKINLIILSEKINDLHVKDSLIISGSEIPKVALDYEVLALLHKMKFNLEIARNLKSAHDLLNTISTDYSKKSIRSFIAYLSNMINYEKSL
jgi:hypothetical protein